MTPPEPELPDWERVLSAERHVQALVPGSVLVGGTAAAIHAQHRRSLDADHVTPVLTESFDDVLDALEAAAGWKTRRIMRPVAILGRMDGVLTGVRQLRRIAPLETEIIDGLRVPTLGEMARIKAWLLATRYTVRDYLDTVVLLERLGEAGAATALTSLDALYPQDSGASVLVEVADRLAHGKPTDAAKTELASYRGLVPPWNDWMHVRARGRHWATVLANLALSRDGTP